MSSSVQSVKILGVQDLVLSQVGDKAKRFPCDDFWTLASAAGPMLLASYTGMFLNLPRS